MKPHETTNDTEILQTRISELEKRCAELEKITALGSQSYIEIQKTCARQHDIITATRAALYEFGCGRIGAAELILRLQSLPYDPLLNHYETTQDD